MLRLWASRFARLKRVVKGRSPALEFLENGAKVRATRGNRKVYCIATGVSQLSELATAAGNPSRTCVIARVNIERRVFCNSRRKKFIFNIRYSDGDSRPFPPSVRFSNRAGLLIAIVLLLQLLVLLLRGAFIAGAELRLCGTSRGLPWSPHSVRPIAMPVSPT